MPPLALDDLIVARATAPGPAALAIVRLDGREARALTERMFMPRSGPGPTAHPRRMIFGQWRDPAGETIDEGLCAYFRAPHSSTGNDMAEFYCHGGAVPARRLIEAALALGARLAEPGEFTRRAFLNGRLDLAQAEAVADLIEAQTDAAARLARGQLAGELSRRIEAVRAGLIDVAAEIEARLDFPEEEIGEGDRGHLLGALGRAAAEIAALLATRRRGRLLREGARVALAGCPNAGKSSLLNALARRERAIVTPHPGTTRDTIECTIDLAGMPLTLIDTAGLRASDEPIERLGIERSRREIEQADLVVLVRDTADPAREDDPVLAARPPDLIVMNKIDLLPAGAGAADSEQPPCIAISATRGDGLDRLERAIADCLMGGTGAEEAFAINLRHADLLARAATALTPARAALEADAWGELVMVDLREAIEALGEILGVETGDAILDRVFSAFCLGK